MFFFSIGDVWLHWKALNVFRGDPHQSCTILEKTNSTNTQYFTWRRVAVLMKYKESSEMKRTLCSCAMRRGVWFADTAVKQSPAGGDQELFKKGHGRSHRREESPPETPLWHRRSSLHDPARWGKAAETPQERLLNTAIRTAFIVYNSGIFMYMPYCPLL